VGLAAGTFLMGTTEFVIAGILPDIVPDLGASVSHAGLLVTAFAVGMIVGGPTPAPHPRPRPGSLRLSGTAPSLRLTQFEPPLLTAPRWVTFSEMGHAVDMLDRGLLCDDELLAAKALGHDLASETGNDAMQLHAGRAQPPVTDQPVSV